MYFASDNACPVHPQVMQALNAANSGYAPSYGGDEIMDRVRAQIRDIFEAPEAAVYLVATGTAANVLSLACLTRPWDAVYCHELAHIQMDEAGAPEFYTAGVKLKPVAGADAKMTPDTLKQALSTVDHGSVHSVQNGALSLTNVTELGTTYSVAEITALSGIAKQAGMKVHLDGARFANALVALGCSAAEMTWKAGVDVVSFGGTKNGLMGVEAVVIFDPRLAWEFELRRKRGAHLFSKHRYLSAQMEAYLSDGLWLELARHSNGMAAVLAEAISALPGGSLAHPVEANMVFANWPASGHQAAKTAGAQFHHWPHGESCEGKAPDTPVCARLVTSWSTTMEDLDAFLKLAAR
jgi:threonine aldolase